MESKSKAPLPLGISVILCTYNGSQKLPNTLHHLAHQKKGAFEWEVIAVDNNSTDGSTLLIQSQWDRYQTNVPISLHHERTPGKYYALQRGIQQARYRYFVICDDDNGLAEDYLVRVFDRLSQHSDIGALGGQSLLPTNQDISVPAWFSQYQEGYAVGKQGEHSGYVPIQRGRLWGAGLASRTDLYKEVYQQPSFLVDAQNAAILSTEDTEFCARLLLKGYQLYYDEKLVLYHDIDASRLTEAYRDKIYANFEAAAPIFDYYRFAIRLRYERRPRWLTSIKLLLSAPVKLLFAKKPSEKRKGQIYLAYLFPSLFKGNNLLARIWQL